MLKKIPHTYVIIFGIILFSAVMTWIVPGGEYNREVIDVNGVQREVVVNNSFHYTDSQPQTWQVFSSFFQGFTNAADIIAFILIIGGAFWIINDSKSIDVGITSFLDSLKRFEHIGWIRKIGVDNIIFVMIMLLFSIFGAVFGMSEETIAFIIIFVPLSIKMGYDSILGVALCFVAAGLGFAGAILNPFTIGIAQGLSNLPLFSGIEYRLFCWVVINLVGFTFILRYANKIKKSPKSSLVYEEDQYWRDKKDASEDTIEQYVPKAAYVVYALISAFLVATSFQHPTTVLKIGQSEITLYAFPILSVLFIVLGGLSLRKTVHYFVLNILFFTILLLIVGVMGYGWYVGEIASLFLAMGIFGGIAAGNNGNKITKLFIEGAADILSAALVVGLAGGIIVILRQGLIIDTILHSISTAMNDMGKVSSVGMMYFFQSCLNIIIPSGSGKAALTMPMMAQFSDLIGISRQATVMAFQFGDGFTNMITPTSGILVGVLGVAKIPFPKWVKWITPLMVILILIGFLLLIPTVTMTLNGF
ncbi:TIGR00366 family protein [Halosquirtibacter laminarini]|uniref:TIGR00366 family protein n=1 Tax=Halosquirtibacter laminarini TaxID=3374600 RepID=A0AC61NC34_9BACT|nr:TIGR00366 family protein [Prolixibacteraceae bacterium]